MKTKNSIKIIGKYLREISVIIIGVTVTLYASYKITNWNEKRDMALYLDAIKLELKSNLADADELTVIMEREEHYSRYLLSHDKKSLNSDTVLFYKDLCDNIFTHVPSTSAFEMFKISGNMRFINNKEVLQSIWDIYIYIEMFRMSTESYSKEKTEEAKKEFLLSKDGKPSTVPMYNFYITDYTKGMLGACKEISQRIKETLTKLETGNF
jgi:uncharacterized LabA/DUF88 family protein